MGFEQLPFQSMSGFNMKIGEGADFLASLRILIDGEKVHSPNVNHFSGQIPNDAKNARHESPRAPSPLAPGSWRERVGWN
jgi:hypothetical protein